MLKTSMNSVKFAKGLKQLSTAENEFQKNKAAQYILELSNKEGGLFSKIVQFLGTSSQQTQKLQNWQEEFDFGITADDIKAIVLKEFGQNWNQYFLEISDESYCASIGQVNRAKLLDGTSVALKIQYPHIEKAIRQQLKLLKLLPMTEKVGPMKKWGVEVSEYQRMIDKTLSKELDYKIEVQSQLAFKESIEELSFVEVANINEDLVTSKCYVQDFIFGDQIHEVITNWSVSEKKELAEKMLKAFLYSVMKGGIIHEDSNHYNYLFKKENAVKVCILDFGQCIHVDTNYQKALIKLFDITINERDVDPYGLLVDIGFDAKKLAHIHSALPLLMRILLEPFIYNFNYELKNWNYKEQIEKVLGDSKWWFRSAGGVKFFEIMKAFAGIKTMIERLQVNINWHRAFQDIISLTNEDWSSYQSQSTLDRKYTFNSYGQKLKIQVKEKGIEKVNLSLPSRALLDLEDYIEPEIQEKLQAREIDIRPLIQQKLSKGMLPGDVFHLVEQGSEKEFKVWIE